MKEETSTLNKDYTDLTTWSWTQTRSIVWQPEIVNLHKQIFMQQYVERRRYFSAGDTGFSLALVR